MTDQDPIDETTALSRRSRASDAPPSRRRHPRAARPESRRATTPSSRRAGWTRRFRMAITRSSRRDASTPRCRTAIRRSPPQPALPALLRPKKRSCARSPRGPRMRSQATSPRVSRIPAAAPPWCRCRRAAGSDPAPTRSARRHSRAARGALVRFPRPADRESVERHTRARARRRIVAIAVSAGVLLAAAIVTLVLLLT